MAEDMKIGTVVVLKSGGPRMTVRRVDGEKVTCTWFQSTSGADPFNDTAYGHAASDDFFTDMLMILPKKEG